jgi:hypothetical protein
MWSLLSRPRRKSSPAKPLSFRPILERLEERDCPSTITLAASVGNDNMVTLTGQVTATPSPGGLTVQLGGVAPGSATTDANGNFSVTLAAQGSGTEYAKTTDNQSNIAQIMVQMSTITEFGFMSSSLDMFTFYGHVTGPNVSGETVTFGGIKDLQGKTATVDANGNFMISVQLDGLSDDTGNATAMATDANGVTSNMAWIYVPES